MFANLVICVVFLVIIIATDYLHTIGMSPISSAVPTHIFHMLVMADQLVRDRNEGEGLVRIAWGRIRNILNL